MIRVYVTYMYPSQFLPQLFVFGWRWVMSLARVFGCALGMSSQLWHSC